MKRIYLLYLISVLLVLSLPSIVFCETVENNNGLLNLTKRIDQICNKLISENLRFGIAIKSLKGGGTAGIGQVIYEKNANLALSPASNMKILTSAAVLDFFGAQHQFKTEVYADGMKMQDSAQNFEVENLYLKGYGDPTLVSERVWKITKELYELGLRKVNNIVVDETYFDTNYFAPGWERLDKSVWYAAPVSALSVNFNTVAVHLLPGSQIGQPGRVFTDPCSDYIHLKNHTKTISSNQESGIYVNGKELVNKAEAKEAVFYELVVTGNIRQNSPKTIVYRSIEDPAIFAGSAFKELLRKEGVQITGSILKGDTLTNQTKMLLESKSKPLGEILLSLNKISNNFVAECLLKTLGAEYFEPPGSTAKGVQAVKEILAKRNIIIDNPEYYLADGSGLSTENRLSANIIASTLENLYQDKKIGPEFVSSLALAGLDGTLRKRFHRSAALGRLRAKTGSIAGVCALSGYVLTQDNEMLAFSFLANGAKTYAAKTAFDRIGIELAKFSISSSN